MTRKLSVLFVLAFFVMSLCSLALAANATSSTRTMPASVANASARALSLNQMYDAVGDATQMSGKLPTQPTALGYFMLGTYSIGTTQFDHQSNDAQQRQIVVGPGLAIHNTFIFQPIGGGTRFQDYVYYVNGNPVGGQNDISPAGGGYGSISIDPIGGKAIAAWHSVPATQCGIQPSIGSNLFPQTNYPIPPNCQGVQTGLGEVGANYIWPRVIGDVNHAGTAPIAHILTSESPVTGDTVGTRSLVYYASTDNVTAPAATCGTFIDSVSALNYDIAASPVSEKVACVYTKPNTYLYPSYGDNDDVVYRESNNLGGSWGVVQHVTNYADTTELIVSDAKNFTLHADEVSALYDANDCLHILFESYWSDPSTHYYLIFPAKLFHFSSCNPGCVALLNDASGYGSGNSCRPPLGQKNISKVSLAQCVAGANTRLYAVYIKNPDYDLSPDSTFPDCASDSKTNGEVYVQGSTDLSGQFWGAPIDITNTHSNGCTGITGNFCQAEAMSSQAPYVTDSLRIQYLLDRDAGDAIYTEGIYTDNPVMNKAYPCYAITTQAIVAAAPTEIVWPFHTTPAAGPNHTATVPITLTNTGNAPANYTRTVSYTPAGSWLSFDQSPTSSVPAGCTYTQVTQVTATGPASEGLYKATITWNYTAKTLLTVPVELYNFTNFYTEANGSLRTSLFRMAVNQNSRQASQKANVGMHYFSDGKDYLFDGSLLLGTGPTALSMSIFADSAGAIGAGDTLIGRTFCTTGLTVDSTGNSSYRFASGTGVNRDSSIAWDAEYYAPKHVDSSNFMVAKFALYAGPKNPAATINNVAITYACDFDVPDDSSDNDGGFDEPRQMVYQQGHWNGANTRLAGMAGLRDDANPLDGGFVLDNTDWVYPHRGYKHDSIWTEIQSAAGYQVLSATPQDMNSMLVFAKSATITPAVDGKFIIYLILAGQSNGNLAGLQGAVDKAQHFICDHLNPNTAICVVPCTGCGDANHDGGIDISDAVFLIQYIFAGGPAPDDCNYANGYGDANGDGTVDISDAVFLIQYIFAGGPVPHCM